MEREGFQMNTIAERIKFAMKAKNKKQVIKILEKLEKLEKTKICFSSFFVQ